MADKPATFTQPPNSTNTSGLTLPVENLTSSSGNAAGSDSESPGRAQITLHTDVLFRFAKSNLTLEGQDRPEHGRTADQEPRQGCRYR